MAFLEEEIDTRLPYRMGYPTLPVFPVTTKHVTCGPIDFPRISQILANCNISQHRICLAHRVNREADLADGEPRLVVVSTYENGCRDNWIKAVCDLYRTFNRPIELVDEQAFTGFLDIGPVLSTDLALINGWNMLLPDFFARIQKQSWITVDVLYRHFPSRGMRPSIIISARDADQCVWWDQILPDLAQHLQAHKLDAELVLLHMESFRLSAADHNDIYMDTVDMGASCGIPHSSASGTLGGRIHLQKDSSTLTLGLTNFHLLEGGLDKIDRRMTGPFPPDREAPYSTVCSPSDSDHHARIASIRDSIERIDRNLADLRQKIQWLSEDDPAWASKNEQKKINDNVRQASMSLLQYTEKFSRQLGSIYAASGFQTCKNPNFPAYEGWMLDWGLIRIDAEKSISNQPQDAPAELHNEEDLAKHYCSIRSNREYEVIKRGRTTGWTTGKVSAIPTTIELQKKKALVYPVVGSGRKFLEPGDSGSFVLLNEHKHPEKFGGAVVGLAFAESRSTDTCYIMPMDLITNHIEQVTKGKVVEPQYVGTV